MSPVLPPANLPPRAAAWGRSVEGSLQSSVSKMIEVSQTSNNRSRSSAGQLEVLSQRLLEVSERSSLSVQLGNLAVTGSATSEPYPRLNQVVSFPAATEARQARVVLSGNVSESPTTYSRMYVYLIHQGDVIGSDQIQPVAPGAPQEWGNDWPALVIGTLQTTPGVSTDITVRVVRGADSYTSGTSTMTLEAPIITFSQSGAAL